jgi:hypothetical protein
MTRINFTLLTTVLSLFLISGCTCHRNNDKVAVAEDTTPANTGITIKADRFEHDLFTINVDSIANEVPKLKNKYGQFLDLFNYKIVNLGSSEDPRYAEALKRFITDYYMNLDYRKVTEVYPDLNDINADLSKAFTIFHENFPDRKIPRIVTCISGWNQSVVTTDSVIGIALDKYLGRNNEYYQKLKFDRYLCYSMQREYIVPDCIRDWGYTEFEFKDSANSVLNNMLYEAKIIYFMKKMLPEASDTLIFGYTPNQLKWCKDNSKEMWTSLVEHKLLFSTQYLLIRKLVYPAPFTAIFTKESPGRAVVWLGYQIIESYMNANKEVTLPQLMKDSDFQRILQKSNFKP